MLLLVDVPPFAPGQARQRTGSSSGAIVTMRLRGPRGAVGETVSARAGRLVAGDRATRTPGVIPTMFNSSDRYTLPMPATTSCSISNRPTGLVLRCRRTHMRSGSASRRNGSGPSVDTTSLRCSGVITLHVIGPVRSQATSSAGSVTSSGESRSRVVAVGGGSAGPTRRTTCHQTGWTCRTRPLSSCGRGAAPGAPGAHRPVEERRALGSPCLPTVARTVRPSVGLVARRERGGLPSGMGGSVQTAGTISIPRRSPMAEAPS